MDTRLIKMAKDLGDESEKWQQKAAYRAEWASVIKEAKVLRGL
jgi:hypothetical protein